MYWYKKVSCFSSIHHIPFFLSLFFMITKLLLYNTLCPFVLSWCLLFYHSDKAYIVMMKVPYDVIQKGKKLHKVLEYFNFICLCFKFIKLLLATCSIVEWRHKEHFSWQYRLCRKIVMFFFFKTQRNEGIWKILSENCQC